jgi:hypothetical protein
MMGKCENAQPGTANMAEIRTVTTLRYKRAEIEKSIANYEKP